MRGELPASHTRTRFVAIIKGGDLIDVGCSSNLDASGGDPWFEDLFATTHLEVANYIARRIDVRDDVSDVMADTYLIAWRKRHDSPDRELWRAWVISIARRVCANWRRANSRRQKLVEKVALDAAGGENAHTFDGDFDFRVHGALHRMKASDQELLTMLAWDDLSIQEMAQVLGITPEATRVRLHRAKRRFFSIYRELNRYGGTKIAADSMGSREVSCANTVK